MADYGKFDPKGLRNAVEKATSFWQEKLALHHWEFLAPDGAEGDKGFEISYRTGYQHAWIYYSSPDCPKWAESPDEFCARAVGHELVHLVVAPIIDPVIDRTAGAWQLEIRNLDEAPCDHIATLVWRLLGPKDRAYVTGLFRAARLKAKK